MLINLQKFSRDLTGLIYRQNAIKVGKLLPKMDSMFMLVLMRKDVTSLGMKIIANQTLFCFT